MTAQSWGGTVHRDTADGIATITIEHGERNLLNPGVMAALREALLEANHDPAVTGILLTGAGEVFCGGLDLPAIRAGADPREFARALAGVLEVFPTLTKPVVAAVNGDAVAGGSGLVGAVDWAAAVPDAKVGTFEVSVGVWPMIAQVPLIHRIGARRAMENIAVGEPFTPQRAYEVGLVQAVTDDPIGACRHWLGLAARAGAVGVHRASVYALAELSYENALAEALKRFVAQFEDT